MCGVYGSGITRRTIMRKSAIQVLQARNSGVFKHSIGSKTGIFLIFTMLRSCGVVISKKRCKHKKITAQHGAVKVSIGALPFFGQSQKLGAISCSK